jgi:hypothetical protein
MRSDPACVGSPLRVGFHRETEFGRLRRVMIRGRWSCALASTAAALLALVGAEVARAGRSTVQDGNDTSGRLDIRSVSQGHSGAKVTHTIKTFGRWPNSLLDEQHSNSFLMLLNTDSDRVLERIVFIITARGRLEAGVLTANGNFLGRTDVSRPNRRSLRVTLSRSRLGNPAGYRWQASSSFRGSGGCRRGCVDRAPNGSRRVQHDLRDPTVSFPQPSPSTNPYNLTFTIGEAGGSGLDFWRLEHRDTGTSAWMELEEGSRTGPKTVPFTETTGQSEEFRVVAVDEHGNRTVSPIREVTVPPRR